MSKEKASCELELAFWRASGSIARQGFVATLVLASKTDLGVLGGALDIFLGRWYHHLLAFTLILLLNLFHLALSDAHAARLKI